MQQSLSSLVDPINRLWRPAALFKGKDFFGELHLRHGGQLVREEMSSHELKIKMVMKDCPKQCILWFCCFPCLCWICKVFPPPLVGWQNTRKFVICINTFTDTGHFTSNIWHHHSFSMKNMAHHNCSLSLKFSASFLPEGLHRRGGLLYGILHIQARKILSKPSHYQGRAGRKVLTGSFPLVIYLSLSLGNSDEIAKILT